MYLIWLDTKRPRRFAALAITVLATVATLATVAAPAHAQPVDYPSLSEPPRVNKTGTRDTAIIVAVEDYFMLPSVSGAIANANDWEMYFRRGLGVPRVHVLANARATREEILRFADLAAEEVEPGGTLWFLFIGHGAPTRDGSDGLLVGADAQQDVNSLAARGVPQQLLLDHLNRGKQAQTVLVVDACFSGRAGDGSALAPSQPVIPTNPKPTMKKTTVVLSAARATEFAGPLPGANRPAFSYLLLGAIRGWAADEGVVSAQEALWYTQRVLRAIPGRFSQTPDLYGAADLVLARGASERDPGIAAVVARATREPTRPATERVERSRPPQPGPAEPTRPATERVERSRPPQPGPAEPAPAPRPAPRSIALSGTRARVQPLANWTFAPGDRKRRFMFEHTSGALLEITHSEYSDNHDHDRFIKTFYEQLTQAGFQTLSRQNTRYGAYSGEEGRLRFVHKNETLSVRVFHIARPGESWLVIGYFPEHSSSELVSAFSTTIHGLQFD